MTDSTRTEEAVAEELWDSGAASASRLTLETGLTRIQVNEALVTLARRALVSSTVGRYGNLEWQLTRRGERFARGARGPDEPTALLEYPPRHRS